MWAKTCSIIAVFYACAGCATAPSAAPTPITVVKTVCLPMKAYSRAQEQAVAAELAKLAPNSALAGFVADYGAMRAADRACQAK